MRTVSKLGLAGLRLGYLVGRPEWIAQLDKVRPPYNVNVLTQAAAPFVLEQLRRARRAGGAHQCRARAAWEQRSTALQGVTVFPSRGEFHSVRACRTPTRPTTALKQQNVLVRNLHSPPLLATACGSRSARRTKTDTRSPPCAKRLS